MLLYNGENIKLPNEKLAYVPIKPNHIKHCTYLHRIFHFTSTVGVAGKDYPADT